MTDRKYSLSKLETVLSRDIFWLLQQCQDQKGITLSFTDDFIEEGSYVKFIRWYNTNFTDAVQLPSKHEKRKYSTTHRVEIAYKCEWKCNMCDNMLKPDFHIDHIIELRDGGKDEYGNLQSLCVACHSTKTRVNTLKRHKSFEKEFVERSRVIEETAFKKFEHVKKSKYF